MILLGTPLHVIVEFEQLQRISRLKSKAAVRRYLEQRKILFEIGSDGAPWTTLEAINRVLLPEDGPSQLNLDACGPRPRRKLRNDVRQS